MFDFDDNFLLNVLLTGEITILGQFSWGSNYTFLVDAVNPDKLSSITLKAVYKPIKGENPLWDFPEDTLAHREVAAYLISEALGWRLVSPTVYREAAPLGPGSLQLFLNHNPEYHYFNFSPEDKSRLEKVVLFDLLINNADRKGGHLIIDADHHLWCIDHGICFHEDDKLRTVIWDYAGQKISNNLRIDIGELMEKLDPQNIFIDELRSHLLDGEIQALRKRAEWLRKLNKYPYPQTDRHPYPWPPL